MNRNFQKPCVLFVSQEIFPFVSESEISITSRQLIQFLYECNMEIRAFMPRYGMINERKYNLHDVIRLSGVNIIINDGDHPLFVKVASIPNTRMQVYFTDNEEFFSRKTLYHDEAGNFCPDNDERMVFYARSVVETVKNLKWIPDIIHCHGWFTSLLPVMIRKAFVHEPQFAETKIIYSVYNDEFSETLNRDLPLKLKMDGLDGEDIKPYRNPTYSRIIKEAINWSDGIILVSDKINRDIVRFSSGTNKPLLENPTADGFIDAYYTFYNEVLEGEAVLGE
ncbi:MAG: glycogen/starch synthase [Bacteroidetes bacterium]|nr:glycogen/starch synthase [Bacteroidota bacterium]